MIHESLDTSAEIGRRPTQLAYTLTDNLETVGVGLVATEQARPLVPAPFSLPDDTQPVTPLVVLANKARSMAVAGRPPEPGAYAMVGLLIGSPDGSGEFNTLLLWHYTSNRHLARGLRGFGIASQYVPAFDFDVSLDEDSGAASLKLTHPAHPALELGGSFRAPDQPLPDGFVANWWARHEGRLIKASTSVFEGSIGEAQLGLSTDANNELGRLIGGSRLGFPVLQRFNSFAHARTELSIRAAGNEAPVWI